MVEEGELSDGPSGGGVGEVGVVAEGLLESSECDALEELDPGGRELEALGEAVDGQLLGLDPHAAGEDRALEAGQGRGIEETSEGRQETTGGEEVTAIGEGGAGAGKQRPH
ncbi:MAG: hypothetical protein ACI8S6_004410 [Myxococcota bacterium]|jgi:hypothetical protein